jgi:hypothetical protein
LARSTGATKTFVLGLLATIAAATSCPASASRTARVTSAPTAASARAVSRPIPDAPPVTMTRLPPRSIPPTTSAAVVSHLKGVVMGEVTVMVDSCVSGDPYPRRTR